MKMIQALHARRRTRGADGAFVMIVSAILWFIARAVMGLRIDEDGERVGLDQVELDIDAYAEFGKSA